MTEEADKPMQSEALKFWLEEYKVLSSDIQSRVTLQHGLLNFQFIFIGAFVALLATMLRDESVSKYQSQLEFIALIAPIIFSMFVWRHSNHDVNIIYKANYIYCILRKKISDITGDHDLLTFEEFIHRCRGFTSRRFGVLAVLGNEHFFHLFFSALSVVVAILVFLKNGGYDFAKVNNESDAYLFKTALIVLDILAFAGAVHLRIKVAKGYREIVQQDKVAAANQPWSCKSTSQPHVDRKGRNMSNKRLSVIIVLVVIAIWIANLWFCSGWEASERGTFGDLFGASNALFSGLAFAGITLALYLQFKQNKIGSIQQFESTFFLMVSLHQQILQDMDIHLKSKKILRGRRCFRFLYKEYMEEYEKVYKHTSGNEISLICATYFDFYKKRQDKLAHYFQTLYNIIKYVNEADSEIDKKKYINLVRAQLSVYELGLLFYNCLAELGRDKFKPLIEQYSLSLLHKCCPEVKNSTRLGARAFF